MHLSPSLSLCMNPTTPGKHMHATLPSPSNHGSSSRPSALPPQVSLMCEARRSRNEYRITAPPEFLHLVIYTAAADARDLCLVYNFSPDLEKGRVMKAFSRGRSLVRMASRRIQSCLKTCPGLGWRSQPHVGRASKLRYRERLHDIHPFTPTLAAARVTPFSVVLPSPSFP